MAQHRREGQVERRLPAFLGELPQNLACRTDLPGPIEDQETDCDVEAFGGCPVRGGAREKGGDFLSETLESREDGGCVCTEGDEMSGLPAGPLPLLPRP